MMPLHIITYPESNPVAVRLFVLDDSTHRMRGYATSNGGKKDFSLVCISECATGLSITTGATRA
jgi:hypothetical protein